MNIFYIKYIEGVGFSNEQEIIFSVTTKGLAIVFLSVFINVVFVQITEICIRILAISFILKEVYLLFL